MHKSIEERLIDNRVIFGNCWRWCGGSYSAGYGVIYYNGKLVSVHRLSAHLYLDLDLNNSKILVCHKNECRFKDCWNPDHLYLGDNKTNMNDLVRSGKHYETKKTHCPQGHEYSKENTIITKQGRVCRFCKNKNERNRYYLRKEKLTRIKECLKES